MVVVVVVVVVEVVVVVVVVVEVELVRFLNRINVDNSIFSFRLAMVPLLFTVIGRLIIQLVVY